MARTFFISDCHLDESRPRLIDVFVRFINGQVPSGDALYILGDLFEYWVGDDAPPGALGQAIECLRKTSERVPIYFIHGNRDFLVGKRFARDSGCRLLTPTEIIDLHGRRTLLMHGDLLCTDDRSYQHYRRLIRNPVSLALTRSLPLGVRLSISQRLRSVSKKATGSKRPEIMDVSNDTVTRYMRRFGVDQLIHGHTHRRGIHTAEINQLKWRRIVLGDWYEHGSVLTVDNGEPQFSQLD